MKLDNETLQSDLAAEYVLGTLQGPARRRLEKMLPAHAGLREQVAGWQQQLAPWASSLAAEPVPDSVWRTIHERLQPPSKIAAPSRFWQGWALGSTALAASLAALLVLSPDITPGSSVSARDVAILNSDSTKTQWVVRLAEPQTLQLTALGTISVANDKSLELWAVPASGKPQSLGILPLTRGKAVLTLNALQQQHLKQAHLLAISIETQGGSTTDVPQGPVIFTGKPATNGV